MWKIRGYKHSTPSEDVGPPLLVHQDIWNRVSWLSSGPRGLYMISTYMTEQGWG